MGGLCERAKNDFDSGGFVNQEDPPILLKIVIDGPRLFLAHCFIAHYCLSCKQAQQANLRKAREADAVVVIQRGEPLKYMPMMFMATINEG